MVFSKLIGVQLFWEQRCKVDWMMPLEGNPTARPTGPTSASCIIFIVA